MKKKSIMIPFSGFYESIHDQELDSTLRNTFDREGTGSVHEIYDRAFDVIDWQHVHNQYAKEYTENLGHELQLYSIEFEDLVSPKYYNYSTDRVFALISVDDIQKMYSEVSKETLERKIEDTYTSYDDYISHYDNDLESWESVDTWDHNQLSTLLLAYWIDSSNGDEIDQFDEHGMMPDCNGWIYNLFAECTGMERIYKVYEYLNEREKRA